MNPYEKENDMDNDSFIINSACNTCGTSSKLWKLPKEHSLSESTVCGRRRQRYMKHFIVAVLLLIAALTIFLVVNSRKINVKTDKNVEGLSDELQEVFYLASLAPSSHNIQSWDVIVTPDEHKLIIHTDPLRHLKVVDPDDRELFISLGCYAGMLEKAFEVYGYSTVSRYENGEIILEYERVSETINDDLKNVIKKRHTNKDPFETDKQIPGDVLGGLCDTASEVFCYSQGMPEFDLIKEATRKAYNDQAYNEEAARELSDWLRLSDSETMKTKDGLPAEQLGITGIKKALYYAFTDHESARGESFARMGIEKTEKQLDGCSAFIVLSSGEDKEDLIQCGMDLVELWLKAVENDVSVHPMSYALEDPKICKQLTGDLGLKTTPQMILRTGYVDDYGANDGIRRDLSEYIKVK